MKIVNYLMIGTTIRIGREILCLPNAGFLINAPMLYVKFFLLYFASYFTLITVGLQLIETLKYFSIRGSQKIRAPVKYSVAVSNLASAVGADPALSEKDKPFYFK